MSKYIHVGFLLYFRGGFAMTWMNVVAMLVWTGASAVLLFLQLCGLIRFLQNTMI